MVRIKHRYLLVQILYPGRSGSPEEDYFRHGVIANTPTLLDPSRVQGAKVTKDPSERISEDTNEYSTILNLCAPTNDTVTIPFLLRLLRASLVSLFGDHGFATAGSGLSIKYWSKATSRVILRCDRAAFRMVWVACTSIKSMRIFDGPNNVTHRRRDASTGDKRDIEIPCVLQVLHVSGTMKKCEEEAVRKNRAICREFQTPGAHLGIESTSNQTSDFGHTADGSEDPVFPGSRELVEKDSEQDMKGDHTLSV